jgi:hypothetical protein
MNVGRPRNTPPTPWCLCIGYGPVPSVQPKRQATLKYGWAHETIFFKTNATHPFWGVIKFDKNDFTSERSGNDNVLPKVKTEWLTHLLRIRDVPGANLHPKTSYPDRFSLISLDPPNKFRYITLLGHGRFVLYSYFINNLVIWRWLSSGMLHYVVLYVLTYVSEEPTASIIRAAHRPPETSVYSKETLYPRRLSSAHCVPLLQRSSPPATPRLLSARRVLKLLKILGHNPCLLTRAPQGCK